MPHNHPTPTSPTPCLPGVGPHCRPLALGVTPVSAGRRGPRPIQVALPAHRHGAHVPKVPGGGALQVRDLAGCSSSGSAARVRMCRGLAAACSQRGTCRVTERCPPACRYRRSLREGIATEAVSVGARLDPETGALLAGSVEVVPSRVAPARRLTYTSVDELLEHADAELEPDLFALVEVRGVVWVRAVECEGRSLPAAWVALCTALLRCCCRLRCCCMMLLTGCICPPAPPHHHPLASLAAGGAAARAPPGLGGC